MKTMLRIKYVEKGKIEQLFKEVDSFSDALDIMLTFDQESDQKMLVVIEAHIFNV